jgi:hypothetical protein
MEFKNMIMPGVGVGAAVGVILSVVGVIPILNICNIACCLWITAGGFAAAYLYGRKARVEMADGAAVGAIYGVAYAVVATVVGAALTILMGMLGMGLNVAQGAGAGNALAGFGVQAGFGLVGAIIGGFLNLVLGVVFGAVGGVLYAATMGKK